MSEKLEEKKLVVLSTAYVSEETSKLFEDNSPNLPGWSTKRHLGWTLFFPKDPHDLVETLEHHKPVCYELLYLVGWAHARGYNGIDFDQDGPVVEELPVYDW